MHPVVPRIAASLLVLALGTLPLAGCGNAGAPDHGQGPTPGKPSIEASSLATETVTVDVHQKKRGLWGQELLDLRAQGGAFARADRVVFEVHNTFDARATALWVEGSKKHGVWSAVLDPATSGVGNHVVTAHGTDAAGAEFSCATSYVYNATFEPADSISVGRGDYDVSFGMAGLKVKRIQSVFGNGLDHYPRYLENTRASVEAFQSKHGLPVTGTVDRATWLALGLDSMEWYSLGSYASPMAVAPGASSQERVEAMIARAREYLGDSYEWDASGEPGQGIDCAGLVIQALYAAGINTGIVNPVTHSTTTWGDQDAANLYAHCNLAVVDPALPMPGDLVFYEKNGVIDHVAIYVGDGSVIEAHPSGVRLQSATYRTVAGVRRVFA